MVEEQGEFREGRGCVEQNFSLRCTVESCLEKKMKVFAALEDLERICDRS